VAVRQYMNNKHNLLYKSWTAGLRRCRKRWWLLKKTYKNVHTLPTQTRTVTCYKTDPPPRLGLTDWFTHSRKVTLTLTVVLHTLSKIAQSIQVCLILYYQCNVLTHILITSWCDVKINPNFLKLLLLSNDKGKVIPVL
jgi:hypothetical protein